MEELIDTTFTLEELKCMVHVLKNSSKPQAPDIQEKINSAVEYMETVIRFQEG